MIAFGSTGSLKKTLPVGSLLVPDDWLHFTPVSTFDYAKGGHVSVRSSHHWHTAPCPHSHCPPALSAHPPPSFASFQQPTLCSLRRDHLMERQCHDDSDQFFQLQESLSSSFASPMPLSSIPSCHHARL